VAVARVSIPVLLCCLCLLACSGSQTAPISYGGGGRSEAPTDNSARGLADYALQPGEVHPYDPARAPRRHRVGDNETLYDIATRYQIPMLALIEQNGLEPPYALAPRTELELPPPRFHIARDGESFAAIAERYHIDTRSLALFNRLALPHEPRPGERIYLPLFAPAEPAAPAASPANVAPGPEAQAGAAPAVQRFLWPLRGQVLTRFGAQAGGGRLDGIEIAGREGARVSAAAEGEVVYAGADLPAYGALVLVRHGDDYVTAYGYGARALVAEGQHVRAGQPVAELGRRPGGARLLFQVRRGRAAVDPLPLLGAE
jgi:lipoprotein NlpD